MSKKQPPGVSTLRLPFPLCALQELYTAPLWSLSSSAVLQGTLLCHDPELLLRKLGQQRGGPLRTLPRLLALGGGPWIWGTAVPKHGSGLGQLRLLAWGCEPGVSFEGLVQASLDEVPRGHLQGAHNLGHGGPLLCLRTTHIGIGIGIGTTPSEAASPVHTPPPCGRSSLVSFFQGQASSLSPHGPQACKGMVTGALHRTWVLRQAVASMATISMDGKYPSRLSAS